MTGKKFDIIVIGCGSGGLSVGLFMGKAGFSVLMISKSDHDIGGDCLNDGCVPSKALIHVAKLAHEAKEAAKLGVTCTGPVDITKAMDYIYSRQQKIRSHENAAWLREQGVEVALGDAYFTGKDTVAVNGETYSGKKIVIATGSSPKKLKLRGIEQVTYLDNESIFHLNTLPRRLLVIGGGPIGMEMAQSMSRLGSSVMVVHKSQAILPQDDRAVTSVLKAQLQKEGVEFISNASVDHFSSANRAVIAIDGGGTREVMFDAVLVAIGRELRIENLQVDKAGIEVKNGKIVVDSYLRTTNKKVVVCGDIAGDLMFSHAAEFHARILLNNFFSPLPKKLNNDHLSWVTFTDPEVATFGLNEKQLQQKDIAYERLDVDFEEDDRAVTDQYQYGKLVLFISKGGLLKKQKILGGTMVAPGAGELIQELILAATTGLSINAIFNKIYPYPVAARINQKAVVDYKSKGLTDTVKKLLHVTYKIFN